MRESVSGREQGPGVNPQYYAEDLAAGKRAEEDFIKYCALVDRPLEPWDQGYIPTYVAKNPTRSRLVPQMVRAPDLFDPRDQSWVELKWRRSGAYRFSDGRFVVRMEQKKFPDYVFLAHRVMPVALVVIIETDIPPVKDMERWGDTPPSVYPTGVFQASVLALDRVVTYGYESAWFPMSAFDKLATIEEYRELLA